MIDQREHGNAAPDERAITMSEQDANQIAHGFELLQERLQELEVSLQFEDAGWRSVGSEDGHEFSRTYLKQQVTLSRYSTLKNPLINRAVTLQSFYVFGAGVQIRAEHADVNAVVQSFLDDPKNKAELTSQQARTAKEVALQVDGNIFFVLFTNRINGRVRVRSIPSHEIEDIVTNPDDAREPWYYKRQWTPSSFGTVAGPGAGRPRHAYYPDWRYRPSQRPDTINGEPVEWDTPVYHVKVGGLDGMRFGVPETYAAIDWARAYKSFLEDWATITRAYSRFAWKLTTPGGSRGVAAAKTKLATTVGTADLGERNPPPLPGSTYIAAAGSGADLTPIKTAGATASAEDGRQIKLMVAAATGMPEFFFGDANVGNHATAKTLDRPTELKFLDRQTLWEDVHQDLLGYVIDQAALARNGKLSGAYAPVEPGDDADPVVVLAIDPATGEPMDRTVSVTFPPILEHSIQENVAAIVDAATLGGHPPITMSPKLVTRLLLQVLGLQDIDATMGLLFPEPEQDGGPRQDDPASEDDISPSSSQHPAALAPPAPPVPPALPQDAPGQQGDQTPPVQPPVREASAAPSSVDVGLPLPLPLADADLVEMADVGPDDLASAERLWREANAGEPTAGLMDAEPEGE